MSIYEQIANVGRAFQPFDAYREGIKNRLSVRRANQEHDAAILRNDLLRQQIDAGKANQKNAQLSIDADRVSRNFLAALPEAGVTPSEYPALMLQLPSAELQNAGLANMLAPKQTPKPVSISPGSALVTPTGEEIYRAPQKSMRPISVSAGSTLIDPESREVIYKGQPSSPLVKVDLNSGENAANKKFSEMEGESLHAIVQRGQDAQDKAVMLRALKENPAITGPTHDFRASAASLFNELGIPISDGRLNQIANLSQYKALTKQLVLNEQMKQKGPQTDSDRRVIEMTHANTDNIQAANQLIINYQLALADRETLLAEMAEDYRLRTGKIHGWRNEIRSYVRNTPLASLDPDSKRLVFWNEFAEAMRDDNPQMSESEIMEYWRRRYGRRN